MGPLSFLTTIGLASVCNGQFLWPQMASKVMYSAQQPEASQESSPCPSPGEDFVFRGSRQSPGLYYWVQQQQDGEEWVSSSYEQAQQSCSGVGSHLPTFKTQEEYEILLDILKETQRPVWLGLTGGSCSGAGGDGGSVGPSDCISSEGDLLWHDGEPLQAAGDFFTGPEIGTLDSGSCLRMDMDGGIHVPEEGCEDADAVAACQFECPGSAPACPPARMSFSVEESVDFGSSFPAGNALLRHPHCDDEGNADSSVSWIGSMDNEPESYFVLDTGCTFEATTVKLWNGVNRHYQNGGVEVFQILVTTNLDGEWTAVAGGVLPDMTGKPCREQGPSTFTFPPTQTRFVMFKALTIRDRVAALQYFDIY